MKRIALAAVLLVMLVGPARAGFDEGMAAYERRDYATALKEFRPLAEQGNVNAQTSLGIMYLNGYGATQDYVQAHFWSNLAASQDNDAARKYLDVIAKLMTPADISKAQAMARGWLEKHQ